MTESTIQEQIMQMTVQVLQLRDMAITSMIQTTILVKIPKKNKLKVS